MEGSENNRSLGRTDHFGNGIEVGFAQTSDALEMGQQCRAGFLSDSLYSVKFRDSLRLAAAVAVVGYSEAVGLVAQVLYHPQSLAVFVDIERNAVTRKIDFLKALRNADHSYFALSPISSRASTAADS